MAKQIDYEKIERSARTRKKVFNIVVYTLLTFWGLMVLFPFYWTFVTSLKDTHELYSLIVYYWPQHPTFDAYEHLFTQFNFLHPMKNSFIVAVITTLVSLTVSTLAAYAFSRFKFPGRRAGMMAFLITQMFPGTMMMIPLYLLLNYLGLLDSMLGLILVYSTSTIPFCTWNLKGYFDTIPHELEEAAIIDGASQARIFWQIIMPLSAPALAVTALIAFMSSWNEYIMAAKFMDSELSYTLPVVVNSYISSKSVQWGYFAAGAVLVSTPIVLLFLALQKFMVGGLTAGGVKG